MTPIDLLVRITAVENVSAALQRINLALNSTLAQGRVLGLGLAESTNAAAESFHGLSTTVNETGVEIGDTLVVAERYSLRTARSINVSSKSIKDTAAKASRSVRRVGGAARAAGAATAAASGRASGSLARMRVQATRANYTIQVAGRSGARSLGRMSLAASAAGRRVQSAGSSSRRSLDQVSSAASRTGSRLRSAGASGKRSLDQVSSAANRTGSRLRDAGVSGARSLDRVSSAASRSGGVLTRVGSVGKGAFDKIRSAASRATVVLDRMKGSIFGMLSAFTLFAILPGYLDEFLRRSEQMRFLGLYLPEDKARRFAEAIRRITIESGGCQTAISQLVFSTMSLAQAMDELTYERFVAAAAHSASAISAFADVAEEEVYEAIVDWVMRGRETRLTRVPGLAALAERLMAEAERRGVEELPPDEAAIERAKIFADVAKEIGFAIPEEHLRSTIARIREYFARALDELLIFLKPVGEVLTSKFCELNEATGGWLGRLTAWGGMGIATLSGVGWMASVLVDGLRHTAETTMAIGHGFTKLPGAARRGFGAARRGVARVGRGLGKLGRRIGKLPGKIRGVPRAIKRIPRRLPIPRLPRLVPRVKAVPGKVISSLRRMGDAARAAAAGEGFLSKASLTSFFAKIKSAFASAIAAIKSKLQAAGAKIAAFGEWLSAKASLSSLGAKISSAFGSAIAATKNFLYAVSAKMAAAAQWLLNAALAANPIFLVVMAVAILVIGLIWLWKTNEGFRNSVLKAWEALKKFAGLLGKGLARVAGIARGALSKIGGGLRKVGGAVKRGLGGLRKFAAGARRHIAGAARRVAAGARRLGGAIARRVGGAARRAGGFLRRMGGALLGNRGAMAKVAGAAMGLVGRIASLISRNRILRGVLNIVRGAFDLVKGVIDKVKGAASSLAGVLDTLRSAWDRVTGAIRGAIDALRSWLGLGGGSAPGGGGGSVTAGATSPFFIMYRGGPGAFVVRFPDLDPANIRRLGALVRGRARGAGAAMAPMRIDLRGVGRESRPKTIVFEKGSVQVDARDKTPSEAAEILYKALRYLTAKESLV